MVKRLCKLLAVALVAVMALALPSCVRRDLVDPGNTHYVRVYLDTEIKNVTTGFYAADRLRPAYEHPDLRPIRLCAPTTGRPVAERYLRNRHEDERGIYYDGYVICDAGDYDVMAYNFGTESTIIRNQHSFGNIEAYTNLVAPHILSRLTRYTRDANERIVYMPDHLFKSEYALAHIAPHRDIDTLTTREGDWFSGASIVKSYYLQIHIRGVQYASSIVGLLTGMGGSMKLHGARINEDDPVTIYFEMAHTEPENDEAVLYTTFHTFGKLEDLASELELSFDIITTDGRGHVVSLDITDEFYTEDAIERQWILIDKVIEIPKPVEEGNGGGFSPGLDDWENVDVDIII